MSKVYNVSGPEGIGQVAASPEEANLAARAIAKEHGEVTITAPHWPENWRPSVTREEVQENAETRFILFMIQELDHKVGNEDADG